MEPHEFGGVVRQLTAEPLWLHLVRQGAQRLGPRPVRGCAARLPAAADQHPDSSCFGPRDQLLGQAALADPGLADQQDQPPTASARILKTGDQLAQLALTADKRDRLHLRCRLRRRALGTGERRRWVLREDRPLEVAQALAGLDPKLLHQFAPCLLISLQRPSLPVAAPTGKKPKGEAEMIRQHHLIRATIALAAALTASLAPAAWADPEPLATAEATIAANSQSNTAVRPNPDEQTVTGTTANPGPCSEVCSGGAGSYRSASQRSSTPNGSGATLPHDSRPRWAAAPGLYSTGNIPPTVIRAVTDDGGFHWGDAGIGAGGMLALTLIGLGGAVTLTHRCQ